MASSIPEFDKDVQWWTWQRRHYTCLRGNESSGEFDKNGEP